MFQEAQTRRGFSLCSRQNELLPLEAEQPPKVKAESSDRSPQTPPTALSVSWLLTAQPQELSAKSSELLFGPQITRYIPPRTQGLFRLGTARTGTAQTRGLGQNTGRRDCNSGTGDTAAV